jgi:hypothetical protein
MYVSFRRAADPDTFDLIDAMRREGWPPELKYDPGQNGGSLLILFRHPPPGY